MRIRLELPAVGRKRLIATVSLAAAASALWIGAPAYLPGASVSGLHVLEGLAIPFNVGWVTLLLMERRIIRDDRRVAREIPAENAERVMSR